MNEQLFQIMRFQVLAAALQSGAREKLHNSYVFAWDASIYPLFNDAADYHKPFADQFAIPKPMIEELFKKLDGIWAEQKQVTFFQIEEMYRNTKWDRYNLILGLRYMWLHEQFEHSFWHKIMEPKQHPNEAREITLRYERTMDVFFKANDRI